MTITDRVIILIREDFPVDGQPPVCQQMYGLHCKHVGEGVPGGQIWTAAGGVVPIWVSGGRFGDGVPIWVGGRGLKWSVTWGQTGRQTQQKILPFCKLHTYASSKIGVFMELYTKPSFILEKNIYLCLDRHWHLTKDHLFDCVHRSCHSLCTVGTAWSEMSNMAYVLW